MGNYNLACTHPECNKTVEEDRFQTHCPNEENGTHGPALLRPHYEQSKLTYREELPGIFSFSDWLPTGEQHLALKDQEAGEPVTYKSFGLAQRLGLKNLYVAFSGFWPERGANLLTRTFKELGGQVSLARYLHCKSTSTPEPLVLSSAGNTANGYNLISSLLDVPVCLVVPESAQNKLLLPRKTDPFTIFVKGTYSDAIDVAQKISQNTRLINEGGTRNVGQRAGLGTVMLHSVAHPEQGTGELFDHYFQAVGSGTGAIAAWEAVRQLRRDGRFGDKITAIHMAQNEPFTPISDAWQKNEKNINLDTNIAREQIDSVTAKVLTNQSPPYNIHGGVYDTLKESGGTTWKVKNYDLFHSARMFRECESVDIGPAASVAVQALIQAVKEGEVNKEDSILLHITGGGKEIQYHGGNIYSVEPDIVIEPSLWKNALDSIRDLTIPEQGNHYLTSYRKETPKVS